MSVGERRALNPLKSVTISTVCAIFRFFLHERIGSMQRFTVDFIILYTLVFCMAYFNCLTDGTNVPPVLEFVPPGLVIPLFDL